jgi:hypothetical protein
MVFKLLRESIGESHEVLIVHLHGAIVAFSKTCENVLQIKLAFDAMFLGYNALSKTISALHAFRRGAVIPTQDSIVHIATERTSVLPASYFTQNVTSVMCLCDGGDDALADPTDIF